MSGIEMIIETPAFWEYDKNLQVRGPLRQKISIALLCFHDDPLNFGFRGDVIRSSSWQGSWFFTSNHSTNVFFETNVP